MFIVCANCENHIFEVASFNTRKEAELFVSKPAVLAYADEIYCGEDDYIVYPEEMWIEEETDNMPLIDLTEGWTQELLDALPF